MPAGWPATVRAWCRIVVIALLLLVCLPPHALWRLLRRPSPWPRRFLAGAAHAAGAEIRIAGEPLAARVLFVANHVSWLDIPVMAGATGSRFVAKDEVAGWPVVGRMARLHHTLFVARARRGQVQDQAARLRDALADTDPLTLFAEGGTGDGVSLRPFRAALFAAVTPAPEGVRVQPVAIDYADARAAAWPDEAGFGEDALRLLGLPGRRRVTLRFGTPIDSATLPDGKAADRKAIAAACQAQVAHMLGVGGPAGV